MPSHNRIASCWGGGLPGECLVLPIRIKERLVSAVLCDPGLDGLGQTPVVELEGLAADAGRALERYILSSKQAASRHPDD